MIKFANPILKSTTIPHLAKILNVLKESNKIIRGKKACQRMILRNNGNFSNNAINESERTYHYKNEAKKHKGILFLPYDISPPDLISHLPILCKNNDIYYCFTTKEILQTASSSPNSLSCCVFVSRKKKYLKEYNIIKNELKEC